MKRIYIQQYNHNMDAIAVAIEPYMENPPNFPTTNENSFVNIHHANEQRAAPGVWYSHKSRVFGSNV